MKTILFIAVLMLLSVACLEVGYYDGFPDNQNLKEAEIVYYGAPEVDGCGWLIKVGDLLYHPEQLDDRFKTDNLPVRIDFIETSDVFRCGRGGVSYKTIRILKVEELNRKKEVGILQDTR